MHDCKKNINNEQNDKNKKNKINVVEKKRRDNVIATPRRWSPFHGIAGMVYSTVASRALSLLFRLSSILVRLSYLLF